MKDLAISIRKYTKDNYKEIIDNIKLAGFKNVFIEWYNDDLKLQEDILNYVKENDLNIIFAHLGYQNPNSLWEDGIEGEKETNRYIKDIKICKKNNIDLVVIHPTLKYVNPGMNEIGLKRIKQILDCAKEYDVKVAFENVELTEYLEYIIKNINHPNLGICFDVGHSHLFNDDNINIDLFKDKVFMIHLHDNFKQNDDHNLPFDGTVNWQKSIKQIKDMNYDGYITIESGCNKNYLNLGLKNYYKLAYYRGLKLLELFNKK